MPTSEAMEMAKEIIRSSMNDPRGTYAERLPINIAAALDAKDAAPAEGGWRDIESALEESIKLQNHYAKLLNMQDGGYRLQFADASAWIQRLKNKVRTS